MLEVFLNKFWLILTPSLLSIFQMGTCSCCKMWSLLLFRYGTASRWEQMPSKRLLLTIPKRRRMVCHARPHRQARGLVRRQREQGENILRAFMVISVGRNGWGRGSSLESAGLNNFSVLCGVRTVPRSLVPSFEVMRAGRWWPRVLARFKGGGWGMGSGVVGLVMKGMLSEGELFNASGNLHSPVGSGESSSSRVGRSPEIHGALREINHYKPLRW